MNEPKVPASGKKSRVRRTPDKKAVRNTAPQKLKLLFTIVDRKKADFYTDLLQSFEVNLQLLHIANGTASSEMRSLLGLSDDEKAILVSVIREDHVRAALETLEEKFAKIRGGKGIAFTVPLTGTIGVEVYRFLCNNTQRGIV